MRLLACIALLLIGSSCAAFEPDEGWYWNPSEGGRGFNIESQNGFMFIAAFVYTPSGVPIWYTTQGTYNRATKTLSGTLVSFTGGQCLGCPFQSRSAGPSGGPITITWDSAVSANVTFNGGSTRIQRFYVSYPTLNSFLKGEWAFTDIAFSLVHGEWLVFDGRFTDSQGVEFITGHRDSGTDIAVGNYDPTLKMFAVLLDSSISFYRFYLFDLTDTRMEGRGWLYEKTGSLSGPGNQFVGFRLAEANELGIPIPQEKSIIDRDAADRGEYARQIDTQGAERSTLDRARLLENALRSRSTTSAANALPLRE